MRSFTFDGTNSAVYGLVVSGSGTFNAPKRDVTVVEVPGHNGTLTIDNGRFKNITVTYPGIVMFRSGSTFADQIRRANAWLCSARGYKRLTDDYHPEYFRLARFKDGADWETAAINTAGRVKIQFDCDPRRFLFSGENVVTKNSSGGYITNGTLFDALPLITVYGSGSGTITVGTTEVAISDIGTSVTLDCEICRAYNGATARDGTISGQYPKLAPGRNTIRWTGGVTKIEITPRWWTV